MFPRVLIAGVQSGVGKTTLTLGILAALKRRGYTVQPFKVGPDYIDPGLHYHASGKRSHNLDSWMGSEQVVKEIFSTHAKDADISIIEGVMGLYDGAKRERLLGSSAHIALVLDAPIILVVNVKGMARSCLALIKGFMEYQPGVQIKGVILNNAGSEYYRTIIKNDIEQELGIKVVGCLSNNKEIRMPERHLGLMPAEENDELATAISKMADMVEAEIDIDTIITIANSASTKKQKNEINEPNKSNESNEINKPNVINNAIQLGEPNKTVKVSIGIAKDEAFSFYYQDSIDFLQELGAKIHYFSPLRDTTIPDVDGLYIGGGFPEIFIKQLSENKSMIASIRTADQKGMPIVAECGGYMYLAQTIKDFSGVDWQGVGLVPVQIEMTKKLVALGYVKATALADSVIASKGNVLKGHEFHYSKLHAIEAGADTNPTYVNNTAFSLVGGKGTDGRAEGYVRGKLCASYVHLHLRSNPQAAINFIEACKQFERSKASFDKGNDKDNYKLNRDNSSVNRQEEVST